MRIPTGIICFFLFCVHFHLSAQFTFVSLPTGVVNKLLVKNGTVYLAADSRAVYTSNDNGSTWSRNISSSFGVGTVNTISFLNNGNLAAGTAANGIKIWNGTTWATTNNGLPVVSGSVFPFITSINCDVLGIIYAASRNYGLAQGGVYMNNGTSWVTITANLPDNNVNALVTGPSGILYAGTDAGIYMYNGSTWSSFNNGISPQKIYCLEYDAAGNLYAGGKNGLYKLPTGNTTWNSISTGLPASLAVLSIGFHPSNPGRLYVGLGFMRHDVGNLAGNVYTTADGGGTWFPAFNAIQTSRVAAISVLSNGNVLAGARGVYASADNGANWTVSSTGLDFSIATTFSSKITITPMGKIFIGTDNGIFASTDNGASWQQSYNGFKSSYVAAINYNPANGYLYASARSQIDNAQTTPRMYRSVNAGASWDTLPGPLDRIYNNFAFKGTDTVYMAHGFGSIPPTTITGSVVTASYNAGNAFTDINPNGGLVGLAFNMAVKPNGDIFVGSETQNVCRSTDGGATYSINLLANGSGNTTVMIAPNGDIWSSSNTQYALFYSPAASNGNSFINFDAGNFPQFRGATSLAFDSYGNSYVAVSSPGPGNPSLYLLSPPFTSSSVFAGTGLNSVTLRDLAWHPCGQLWGMGPGVLVVSNSVLTAPFGACINLPVQLVSFKGEAGKRFNILQWKVSDESGITWYELQASANSIDFTTEAIIPAVNTPGIHDYHYRDDNPPAGIQYYRLKIIKQDGSFSYSAVVRLNNMPTEELAVYPSPVHNYMHVRYTGTIPATIIILDVRGRLVKRIPISQPDHVVPVNDMVPGIYLITVKGIHDTEAGFKKIIIQ